MTGVGQGRVSSSRSSSGGGSSSKSSKSNSANKDDGSKSNKNGIESRKSLTNRDKMLANILEQTEFHRTGQYVPIPLAEDPLLPLVEAIALAADKRKAGTIQAFRICHLTEITTFMVVVEGNSRPQNQAIALSIEEDVLLNFTKQPSKEGDAASGWILLDYGSVIVHVMTPQMRNYYKLERRWKEAEMVDLSKLFGVATVASTHVDGAFGGTYEDADVEMQSGKTSQHLPEEGDPFWS